MRSGCTSALARPETHTATADQTRRWIQLVLCEALSVTKIDSSLFFSVSIPAQSHSVSKAGSKLFPGCLHKHVMCALIVDFCPPHASNFEFGV